MKHIEEVSMSVLFLMEAAKKVDRAFNTSPQTTAHTIHDTVQDVQKISQHLVESRALVSISDRSTPLFVDPTDTGLKKLNTAWLKDTLARMQTEADTEVTTGDELYELWDTV